MRPTILGLHEDLVVLVGCFACSLVVGFGAFAIAEATARPAPPPPTTPPWSPTVATPPPVGGQGPVATGRVVDQRGQPITRARVRLLSNDPRAGAAVYTDERGEYSLPLPAGMDLEPDPDAGDPLQVEVAWRRRTVVVVRDPAASAPLRMTPAVLEVTGGVRVRVRDDAGVPVPGLRVTLGTPVSGTVTRPRTPRVATTDAQGQALFEALDDGRWAVEVAGAGLRAGQTLEVQAGALQDVAVAFTGPRLRSGLVVGADGAPVASAQVTAGTGTAVAVGSPGPPAVTDAAGAFRLELPYESCDQVWAWTVDPPRLGSVSLSKVGSVTVRLAPWDGAEVQVRAAGGGSPAPGATLRALFPGVPPEPAAEAPVGPSGRARLLAPPGTYQLELRRGGQVVAAQLATIGVAGRTATIDERGARVTGVVVDRGGRPQPGVLVLLSSTALQTGLRTDGAGRFESPLLAGGEVRLLVRADATSPRRPAPPRPGEVAPGGAAPDERGTKAPVEVEAETPGVALTTLTLGPTEARDVTLTLGPGTALRVKVLLPAGGPGAGLGVLASRLDAPGLVVVGPGSPDGVVTLEALPPGKYRLGLAPGRAGETASRTVYTAAPLEVRLEAGPPVEVELKLRPGR